MCSDREGGSNLLYWLLLLRLYMLLMLGYRHHGPHGCARWGTMHKLGPRRRHALERGGLKMWLVLVLLEVLGDVVLLMLLLRGRVYWSWGLLVLHVRHGLSLGWSLLMMVHGLGLRL